MNDHIPQRKVMFKSGCELLIFCVSFVTNCPQEKYIMSEITLHQVNIRVITK